MDNDDYVVEDILMPKSKKKNSASKGKRRERELAGILTKRFKKTFSRSIGSGNRWSQVGHLPKHAKDTLTGDLCCPEGFSFVIESKGGYDDIDLNSAFAGGHREVDEFLEQVTVDSKRCDKKPILLWKKNRKPWLAILKTNELVGSSFEYKMDYRDWTIVALDDLLKLEDAFFFI